MDSKLLLFELRALQNMTLVVTPEPLAVLKQCDHIINKEREGYRKRPLLVVSRYGGYQLLEEYEQGVTHPRKETLRCSTEEVLELVAKDRIEDTPSFYFLPDAWTDFERRDIQAALIRLSDQAQADRRIAKVLVFFAPRNVVPEGLSFFSVLHDPGMTLEEANEFVKNMRKSLCMDEDQLPDVCAEMLVGLHKINAERTVAHALLLPRMKGDKFTKRILPEDLRQWRDTNKL